MVYGILGLNGSGKIIILGMVLDIIYLDSGFFEWFEGQYGCDVCCYVGVLLEMFNFYFYFNVIDNLGIVVYIKQVKVFCFDELLKLVNFYEWCIFKFCIYFLGMKQCLVIVFVMVGDLEVFIFDEFINGFDFQGIVEICNIL